MSDHDEIIRLRDRFHEMEGSVSGLVYGQRGLERSVGELRDGLRDLRHDVTEMSKTDEIAAAVTAAVRSDRKNTFTLWQKAAGAFAAAIMLAPSAHVLAAWMGLVT